jgi:CRISPR-associated endoribonuclease Cas6
MTTADNMLHPEILSDMLYDSTMYRMEKTGLYKASEIEEFYQFQLIPDRSYLQKINEVEKKAARSYYLHEEAGASQEIIGYTFPFKLLAHPKVQNFIFHCGFGEFTNSGYGMLDRTDTTSAAVEPYRVDINQKMLHQHSTKTEFAYEK